MAKIKLSTLLKKDTLLKHDDNTEVVLKIDGVSKVFNLATGLFSKNDKHVYAVNGVSITLQKGQTYGIVGESGCGKTTLAKCITGMYKADSGSVLYEGIHDISGFRSKELKEYREKVKYVFQDPAKSLNPRMNVYNILTSALRYSSLWKDKEDAKRRASLILDTVGLPRSALERRPSEFSGGQRQRISIARALIMEPQVIICDEVVSALDVSIQGQVLNLLTSIKEERKLAYIFIAHDLKVSSWFCDTIGVMFRGMIVEEAPAVSLYKNAMHPYTELLFDGAQGKHTESNLEVKTTLHKESGCPFAYRCPKADNKCMEQCPELVCVKENHKVRCWKA